MTAITGVDFRGEVPRRSPHLLPPQYAQSAVNCRLLNGDLVPLTDKVTRQTFTGGPFKSIFLLLNLYWLRWAKIVDVARSVIPGDTTGRIYFTTYGGTGTGLDRPRITNTFYATDPSQQGGNPADGYPYVSYPLGSPNPLNPATATTAALVGSTTEYDFAQQASVNNATVAAGGTLYVVGNVLNVNGGTLSTGLTGAQLKVTAVDATTGAVTAVSLVKGGFYTAGNGPTSPATSTATSGAGTGATFTVTNIAQSFAGFNTYTTNNGAGYYIQWTIASNVWRVDSGQGGYAMANSLRAFGLQSCTSFTFQSDVLTEDNGGGHHPDIVMSLAGTYSGQNTIVGPGVVLSLEDATFTLYGADFQSSSPSSATAIGTIINQLTSITFSGNTWYRLQAVCTANTSSSSPGFDVTVTLATQAAPGTILYTLNGFIPLSGESLGVGTNHRGPSNNANGATFENILISVALAPDESTLEATEYVFTYVTGLGEESAPSPASALIQVVNDTSRSVSVMLPGTPQANETAAYGSGYISDYGVTLRRLYRSVGDPAVFLQVVELPIATTSYIDTIADANLGVELPSEDWELPPADGHSIISLPNGITALASKNTVYLSALGQAHAYPLDNRLPADSTVVALGAIDTTIVVLTDNFPYIASGTDPSTYGMAKLERSYGCVSHRSVTYLRQFGIIYASNEGLIATNGAGLRNITEAYYAKQDWAAFNKFWQFINPSSIVATTIDDRYVAFCQPTDGTIRGFIFDPKEEAYGWTWFDLSASLNYTATPADGFFSDSVTGKLYMVRGSNRDEFDAGAALTAIWRSKLFRQSFPTAFLMGRVKPSTGYDYTVTPITAKFIVDGVTIVTTVVQNRLPFTIPAVAGEDIEIELRGKYPLEEFCYVTDPMELT